MATAPPSNVTELLLMRQGVWFLPPAAPNRSTAAGAAVLRGFELEAANLGYVLSQRLRARLSASTSEELGARLAELREASRKVTGGDAALEPLFRRFPDGVPEDTEALWWQRVVVHYLQTPGQPCVWCSAVGSTHVLDPCRHIVCDRCFDGRNYSGCPVCGHKVSRSSPFFAPSPTPAAGSVLSPVRFKLLELGPIEGGPFEGRLSEGPGGLAAAAATLFAQLVARPQAMSPVDVEALRVLTAEFAGDVLRWLPPVIPARENTAHVFAALIERALDGRDGPSFDAVWAVAQRHMNVATDVLRFLSALSGQSPGLVPVPKLVLGERASVFSLANHRPLDPRRYPPKPGDRRRVSLTIRHQRFPVRKLPRFLRRAVLALLDGLPQAALAEDLWRHRSRWLWVARFLHPGEYSARFTHIAAVFAWLRNPERVAPPFPRWASRVEAALARKDDGEALALLAQRPGEWLRRLDGQLRRSAAPRTVLAAFLTTLPRTALPALLSLKAHLARRAAPLPARVYFPKRTFWVPKDPRDTRPPLPHGLITAAVDAIDAELLRRLQRLPSRATAVLDEALTTVLVPFGERSASRSGVAMARGSSVAIPQGHPHAQVVRFFLHWCQPAEAKHPTDIDLSVGFFDAGWRHLGTCAYYELTAKGRGGVPVAKSSGDFTSAPWPDGAAEFVDLDRAAASAAGYRYAVMVVNAYSGQPFHELARVNAGVMLRDSVGGTTFAPASVEHAFALDGDNGNYMPLLVDLAEDRLHWLDAYAKGLPAMNNVATASATLQHVASAMLGYFGGRPRPSLFELVALHAAARCPRVIVRRISGELHEFQRRSDESVLAFHQRLRRAEAPDQRPTRLDVGAEPALAALAYGDVELPAGSDVYALFRRGSTPNLAAADFLAVGGE